MPETPDISWGAARRADGNIDVRIGGRPAGILSEHAALGLADMLRRTVLGAAATDA
jgi:hypothetical protein